MKQVNWKKKYFKLKKEHRAFVEYHNTMNDFVDVGLRTSEKDFKSLITAKLSMLEKLDNLNIKAKSKSFLAKLYKLCKEWILFPKTFKGKCLRASPFIILKLGLIFEFWYISPQIWKVLEVLFALLPF